MPAAVADGYLSGPVAIAMTRTGQMLLMVFAILLVVARMRYAPIEDLLALIWRPAIVSATIWATVSHLPDLGFGGHALALARDVTVGISVFVTTVVLLWFVAGRPEGPERNVLAFARQRLRRLLG